MFVVCCLLFVFCWLWFVVCLLCLSDSCVMIVLAVRCSLCVVCCVLLWFIVCRSLLMFDFLFFRCMVFVGCSCLWFVVCFFVDCSLLVLRCLLWLVFVCCRVLLVRECCGSSFVCSLLLFWCLMFGGWWLAVGCWFWVVGGCRPSCVTCCSLCVARWWLFVVCC